MGLSQKRYYSIYGHRMALILDSIKRNQEPGKCYRKLGTYFDIKRGTLKFLDFLEKLLGDVNYVLYQYVFQDGDQRNLPVSFFKIFLSWYFMFKLKENLGKSTQFLIPIVCEVKIYPNLSFCMRFSHQYQ